MKNNLTTPLRIFYFAEEVPTLSRYDDHNPQASACKKANILCWAHFSIAMPQEESFTPFKHYFSMPSKFQLSEYAFTLPLFRKDVKLYYREDRSVTL